MCTSKMDKYMEKETKRESYRKPQNNKIDELMNEWIDDCRSFDIHIQYLYIYIHT